MASIINSDDGVISGTAGLKSTGANDGALNIQTNGTNAITVSSAQTVAINGNNISADNSLGFRNRIINGDMRIDQRNAGASVTPTSGQYLVDRWLAGVTQASKFSVQQNAGSVTPPAGFTNYLGVTSLSAYSIVSSDIFFIAQRIEGLNCADLAWGTANAKTVTLSFWVRSSLTGTFGGSLANSGSTRSYPFTYTISAANTWEQKSVTIAGDTSGTWLTTNGIGINVHFSLGSGSTYSGTAGAWAAANYTSSTGATSVVGTNGATLYITGVQLEVGSVATPFERRDYGRELIMCQRYYYLHATGNTKAIGSGGYTASNILYTTVQFPVSMRTAPTSASATGTNYYNAAFGSSNDGVNSLTLQFTTEQSTFLYNTAEASGTANSYAVVYTNNASALLAFQAEL
jgi:hypothetical protein